MSSDAARSEGFVHVEAQGQAVPVATLVYCGTVCLMDRQGHAQLVAL